MCFGAADEALTLGAVLSARSPFLSPFDRRDAAHAAHAPFRAENSDHLALLRAHEGFRRAAAGGGGAARRWCEGAFISYTAMEEVDASREQLAGALADAGFARASVESRSLPLVARLETSDDLFQMFATGTARTRAILERQTEAQLAAIRQAVAAGVEACPRGEHGYEVPMPAVMVSGQKPIE